MDKKIKKILSNLDEEQKIACTAPLTNILINAVAGSGKTRTLTHRVSYLIEKGINPNEVLLLTFTNKASEEMTTRIKKLINNKDIKITGGTFHSIGARLLRKYASVLGYGRNFTILDTKDAKALINSILIPYLKTRNVKRSEFPNKKVIYNLYTNAINLNKSISNISNGKFDDITLERITEILKRYKTLKLKTNCMDFDDLILNFYKVLKHESIRKKISNQFKYVFCDEYQDVNWIQYGIIKLINQDNDNLCVVGDGNQSIYKFRGADISYIQNFKEDFKDSKEYFITTNYRSNAPILKIAEDSINNNYQETKTIITPFLNQGNKPIYVEKNRYSQSDFIIQKINELKQEGTEYKEMAILLRMNYLTVDIERALQQARIPYVLLSGLSFFERAHIKDVTSFLKLNNNHKDKGALLRVLKLMKGIGDVTANKIYDHLESYDFNFEMLKTFKISKRARGAYNDFVDIMCSLDIKNSIESMIEHIMKEFYQQYMVNNFDEFENRLEDIKYMINESFNYSDLSDFLEDMTLNVENKKEEKNGEGVIITTFHKSKGLEWDVVILPYLAENVLPFSDKPRELEEERRLFYVGVTRARKELFLVHVPTLPYSDDYNAESRFITELTDGLLDCYSVEEIDYGIDFNF